MKVAIIGLGPGAGWAPLGDPDWQCWSMLWDVRTRYQADALFEMHDMAEIERDGHLELADDVTCPIYWQAPPRGNWRQYPLADVIADLGRDWFESSVSYMIALAIHRKAEEIGLWGVHGDDAGQYLHQRPNISWLLGLAEGRGMKVTLPEGCRLLTYTGTSYPARYGYA